jgi:hypothetical protein
MRYQSREIVWWKVGVWGLKGFRRVMEEGLSDLQERGTVACVEECKKRFWIRL